MIRFSCSILNKLNWTETEQKGAFITFSASQGDRTGEFLATLLGWKSVVLTKALIWDLNQKNEENLKLLWGFLFVELLE